MEQEKKEQSGKKEISMRKKLLQAVEKCGWTVETEGKYINLLNSSPAGEQLVITISARALPREAIDQIVNYANNFDVDEHVEMWVQAKASGSKGIPPITTLVKDASEIAEMLKTLAETVEEIKNQVENLKKKGGK